METTTAPAPEATTIRRGPTLDDMALSLGRRTRLISDDEALAITERVRQEVLARFGDD